MFLTLCKSKLHRATAADLLSIVLLNGDNSVRETLTADPGTPIGVLSESV